MSSRPTLKFDISASAARPIPLVVPPARLLALDPEPDLQQIPRRRRVWEISRHLHCSIVGTCLSSAELRHVLAKAGRTIEGMTEHELHGIGVLAAGRSDIEGKLLNKALEKRNRQAVVAFSKAPPSLRCWRSGAMPSSGAKFREPIGPL
ncbi:MAG: hypothetical protein AB7O71_10700 [Hyphomicrobiaceae bacterium]